LNIQNHKPALNTTATDTILKDQVAANRTPSVTYIFFNKERVIHQVRLGFADLKKRLPVNERTKFNAFSVTKTLTALAVMQLVENGKLEIDDPVKQYLADFPYSSKITIKQLLSHSAGIPNPIPLGWIHGVDEEKTFKESIFFKQVFGRNNMEKSPPNEKYAYSNLGYVFLGQLIEKVSKQSYKDYVRDHIIMPLNMSSDDIGFEIGDPSRQAKGYQKRFRMVNILLGLFIEKSKYMGPPEGKWKPFNAYYVNGPAYGGLIGTANAFVRYLQELLKPDCLLLSNRYKEIMFTENHNLSGKPTGMCLSWFKGQTGGHQYFSHAGGGGGYYCELRIYPEQKSGSVIMFNRTGMTDERFLDKPDMAMLRNREQG
jgi:CubicO group peptidase (beta-lactamase class C family)